jgi:hypothetical protein
LKYSRLLKTVFIIGCVATISAAILAPKLEGYGDFVAQIFLVSLSLLSLTYCLYAFNAGEVEVKGVSSKRSESPGYYWFGMLIYLSFSIAMLSITFVQLYT